ncbi:VOC family protein [Terrarubrum flagellatum]|uniref:VOC family protein n=1 Tax=Terrirubrum flagellatum TaxID=2895980 RepID=UPI00314530A7
MQVNAYLAFDGNCEEAFKFYEKTFGGKIEMMMRYKDAPPEQPVSPESRERIMHTRMTIGDTLLMASDAPLHMFKKPQGIMVSLQIPDPNEADRVFAALAEGGETSMPIQKTFWAERFGMCTDRFGIPWMVNCEAK